MFQNKKYPPTQFIPCSSLASTTKQ